MEDDEEDFEYSWEREDYFWLQHFKDKAQDLCKIVIKLIAYDTIYEEFQELLDLKEVISLILCDPFFRFCIQKQTKKKVFIQSNI